MHKNKIWLFFLSILSLVSLWFCGVAAVEIYKYAILNGQTPAQTILWSIVEIDENSYYPHAAYSYLVKNREYHTEETLKKLPYKNEWAAEQGISDLSQKKWQVWYNTSTPSYSTISKGFPLKESLYAGVLIGIILYFLGLGYYVGHRYQDRK